MRGLYQALAVAAMCLQEQAATRPLIGDVVTALSYLASQSYDPNAAGAHNSRAGGGPSTPRGREDWKSLSVGGDSQLAAFSPARNSPDFRKRDLARGVSFGAEVGRGELGGGSGRKTALVEDLEGEESQRGSPMNAPKARNGPRNANRDADRERAIAEAKVWGENWRDRRHANAQGSFDSTHE